MYITSSRNVELLSGSDEAWYKSNLVSNEFCFHCFDKYLVVHNRPEIDFWKSTLMKIWVFLN